ncbi:hypothetical protein D9619_000180 [Psilocybe cf. subviscida]|uniref:Uncharacterized protein n=1 Tax=Psilocybe cf. subviscida TaxID=2480587 RepID=A0A8H5BHF0_9AGAR|nr:hypothetical protein D9619_000180 [Psilocybe cf. subviscida]
MFTLPASTACPSATLQKLEARSAFSLTPLHLVQAPLVTLHEMASSNFLSDSVLCWYWHRHHHQHPAPPMSPFGAPAPTVSAFGTPAQTTNVFQSQPAQTDGLRVRTTRNAVGATAAPTSAFALETRASRTRR